MMALLVVLCLIGVIGIMWCISEFEKLTAPPRNHEPDLSRGVTYDDED